MRHFRSSIASVLGGIAVVAVGLTALREADERWDRWLFSLTLGLLLVAVLLAIYRTGERRAFWVGFVVCGGGYLSLTLIPPVEARLITTKGLAWLHEANPLGLRAYRMRFRLDLDLMRANNVSVDHLIESTQDTRMLSSAEVEQGSRIFPAAQVDGTTLIWDVRDNQPGRYISTIIRATPEEEILRIGDVARLEVVTPFYFNSARSVKVTFEDFARIGHTLLTLLAAGLGGVLARRLRRASTAP